MGRTSFYTAIDVGTTKVCVLVGALGASGRMEVIGTGLHVSRGLRKGTVVDVSEARKAIQIAVGEAELESGVQIREAIVGATGTHVESNNVSTHWQREDQRFRITSRDLEPILATTYAIPPENTSHRLLHAIPRSYVLDGQPGIRNPVGMYAHLMQVETHLITGARAPIENLVQAVESAGVSVQGLVLEPLASSEAVMSADEREIGAVLIDIGGGTSDIAIFKNGSIWYTGVIPVGGYQFTNDISIGLSTPFSAAEEAKVTYGHASPEAIDETQTIEVPRLGSEEVQTVSRRALAEIIRERCEELVKLVLHHVQKAELERFPPAGVIFTGGTAVLPGLVDLARQYITSPVRIGVPRGLIGNVDALNSPKFATGTGILLWGTRHHRMKDTNGYRPLSISSALLDRLTRLFTPRQKAKFVFQHMEIVSGKGGSAS